MYRPEVSSEVDWPTRPAIASPPSPTIFMFAAVSPAPVRTRVIWNWKSPAISTVFFTTSPAAMPRPRIAAFPIIPVLANDPAPSASTAASSVCTPRTAVFTPADEPRNSMKTGGRAPMPATPRHLLWTSGVVVRGGGSAGGGLGVGGLPDRSHLRLGLAQPRLEVRVGAFEALLV